MVLFSPAWVERGQVVYAVPPAPTVDSTAPPVSH